MRRLLQPGPVAAERVECVCGNVRAIGFTLQPGLTLNEALTRPLIAAGMHSAALTFSGGALSPFVYVMPAEAPDDRHVAYFSAPHAPAGETRVDIANATFGWRDGAPFVHVHGAWIEPDGRRLGGHMMAHETIVAAPIRVQAWALADVRIEVAPDPETNFCLFHPVASAGTGDGRAIVARIRPNEDICTALEAICRRYGVASAIVRASLGSLVGARFESGGMVEDLATEVLVRHGTVRRDAAGEWRAELDMLVVDMNGTVHEGRLVRGENPVCICFELVLETLESG
jgi:predicted DNA-binding protein with PD1-like motif